MTTERFNKAIDAFDAYNSLDPNRVDFNGKSFPKEILYAKRMTERLGQFAPIASESVKLAARCQHIGRWEIARANYSMDKKGYFQWRNEEKVHHAKIAEQVLDACGYDSDAINRVKALVLKKELRTDPETQLLEDVVCLVFIEFYLEEFAARHEGEKVIDIIKKTARKMSPAAIEAAGQISVSNRIQSLMRQALAPTLLFPFEEEFMENEIRCIPMVVRFKLDACGIKLKLSEWNLLTLSERNQMMQFPTPEKDELEGFRNLVKQFVVNHTGIAPTDMPVEENPAWMVADQIPANLLEKAKEFNWSLSLNDWQGLSHLQRFVLLKLSRPHHANKNFPKAMKEFGLVR
jgi:hypothetical protein